MPSAVIYDRVSTARQAEEGRGLEDRRPELRQYCERQGLTILGEFEDPGVSGREGAWAKRRGLHAAIKLACEQKACLVVYGLSRLSRSIVIARRVCDQLRAADADLAVVDFQIDTRTAVGKMVFSMLACVYEMVSDQIGESVKLANKATVKRLGYRTQGVQPFGYDIDPASGMRVPVESEQRALTRLRELANKRYARTNSEIARILNAEGVPTRAGKGWSSQMVGRILKRGKTRPATA